MRKLFVLCMLLGWPSLAGASASFPNEPAGFVSVTSNQFNTLTGNGWGDVSNSHTAIVTDGTAPLSPSNVMKMWRPYNSVGGSKQYFAFPTARREGFIGFWWKPSNPFSGWSNEHQKLWILFDTSADFGNLWLEMMGPRNSNQLELAWVISSNGALCNGHIGSGASSCGSRNIFPNVAPQTYITLGDWHKVEVYFKNSTTISSQNGILKWWLDGVLVGNIQNANTAQQYGEFSITPSWDSPDPTQATSEDSHAWDSLYLSAPIGNTPVDTTPPGPTTNLAAPATSSTSSQLTWTLATDSGGSGLASTVILRSTGAGITPTQTLTTIFAPTATYLDSSLAAGTTYNYRVQGVDQAGNIGPVSATVTYVTAAAGSGAISFDAVTNSASANTAAALTPFSHTVGAGANRLLAVCTQARGALANVSVASVTYGGTPLALARGDTLNDGAGTYLRTELWYLAAPSSGAGNVAVTFNGTLAGYGVATATSYAGVDQTTPIEASAGASGAATTTLAATVTTLTSDAWIQDCAIGRQESPSGFVSVGSGQIVRTNRLTTGAIVDDMGVSTVNGKTPAGSEVMDWTQSDTDNWVMTAIAIKPTSSGGATPAPVIDSLTRTATTLTITYGTGSPTIPTYIRLAEGNNAGTSSTSVEYTRAVPPFSAATGTTASMTLALLPGADYACVFARDASHVENQNASDYKCFNTTGLTSIDTAAPILSNLRANGNIAAPQLPNGATSFTLSLNVNKAVLCLYDTTTHATYAAFPNTNSLSVASLTVSAVIASGVPAYPATQAYYVMCRFTDVQDTPHDSAVSAITVSAAAPAGDTTAPATVNVTSATALSQSQAVVVWDATTDNVAVTGYTPVCSFGVGSVTYVPCANETVLTTTLLSLPQNTVVNIAVIANDAAGNESLLSNVKTITTTALPDLNPPSNMSSLSAGMFMSSALLIWPQGSDAEGVVTTTIEQCLQVSPPTKCTNFAFKQDKIALSVVSLNLAASTSYCWRGRFVDGAGNVSPAWSPVACGTTKSSGLAQPRTEVPFPGRVAAGTRLPRTQ